MFSMGGRGEKETKRKKNRETELASCYFWNNANVFKPEYDLRIKIRH